MISVKPFDDKYLEETSQMFTTKYRALQSENDLLPAAFQDETAIRTMLEQTIREHPGAVAIERHRVVGYLTGFSKIPALKSAASGVYVPVWGHCVDNRKDTEAVYAALYSQMSAEWVAGHCYTHLLTYFVPGGKLETLLFGLGFGLLLIAGIRACAPLAVTQDDNIDIHKAREKDFPVLMEMERQLVRHLRRAPIFLNDSVDNDESLEEIRAYFLGEGTKTFIAKEDEGVIACIRGELNKGPGCDLFEVDGSLGINFAYTNTATRKKGIATHLLHELLVWGHEQNMTRSVVDFEAANLVAKEFWLKHFQPICYSVIRRIDERL